MSVNPWNDTMQHAITEVQARIRAVYPDAMFRLVEGEDPVRSKYSNLSISLKLPHSHSPVFGLSFALQSPILDVTAGRLDLYEIRQRIVICDGLPPRVFADEFFDPTGALVQTKRVRPPQRTSVLQQGARVKTVVTVEIT